MKTYAYLLAVSYWAASASVGQGAVTVIATNASATGFSVRTFPGGEFGDLPSGAEFNLTFTNCEGIGLWDAGHTTEVSPIRALPAGGVYALNVTGAYAGTPIYSLTEYADPSKIEMFWGGFFLALGMGLFRYIGRMSKKVAAEASS